MKRDFLTELGLESEQVDKIMKEHGKAVNALKDDAEKVTDLEKQIEDLNNQIKDRDKQLKDLEKSAQGNEDLQQQIKDLQKANDDTKKEYEEKLNQQRKESKLELALKDAKAKNPKAVKALLDADVIKLDGDKLLGLEEQLNALKDSDGYLFGSEEDDKKLNGRSPVPSNNGGGEPTKNPFSKEHFNLTEQARLMKEDPELYQKMKAQAN